MRKAAALQSRRIFWRTLYVGAGDNLSARIVIVRADR